MTILATIAPTRNANSATHANPRDSWPDWTDADRWELAPEADERRPTAGPDFVPTLEEVAEAAELIHGNDGGSFDLDPTDAEWDAMAEDAQHLDAACSGYPWL